MSINKPQQEKKGGSATDHLANERTFLAWIRTAIAIMAFGFVVVKFSLFIKQLSLAFENKAIILPGRGYSSIIGIFPGGTWSIYFFACFCKV